MMDKGYVQAYTGEGKGKTTAALGLAFRAVGNNMKVIIFQFLKGRFSGEIETAKRLYPDIKIKRICETTKFTWQMDKHEKDELRDKTQKELNQIKHILNNKSCDILILDEIIGALNSGFITMDSIIDIIDNKPDGMEIVLTGRELPDILADKVDLITEMKKIKHYADKGIIARPGIEE